MKNILKITFCLFISGFISMNFRVNNREVLSTDILVQNIKVMQVSAGEQYCDNKAYKDCSIKFLVDGKWVTGYSTGNLIKE